MVFILIFNSFSITNLIKKCEKNMEKPEIKQFFQS